MRFDQAELYNLLNQTNRDDADGNEAFELLCGSAEAGGLDRYDPHPSDIHIHTNRSYNWLGWSPRRTVLSGYLNNAQVVGTVDFDTLNSMDAAWDAGLRLGQKVVSSFETRVFLPDFADIEINSPGEPGVAYMMIFGCCPGLDVSDALEAFAATAHLRNQLVLINLLDYLGLDDQVRYDEVVGATVSKMPTERHLVGAVINAVDGWFELNSRAIADFWSGKLPGNPIVSDVGVNPDDVRKLIKVGGPAYLPIKPEYFATIQGVHQLAKASGGVPAYAVLNGKTPFEKDAAQMIIRCDKLGLKALNFIFWRMPVDAPSREWNNQAIELACDRAWLVAGGCEMNSNGQVPLGPANQFTYMPDVLEEGALALYGSTVMQRSCGQGWTDRVIRDRIQSDDVALKFYIEVGQKFKPAVHTLEGVDEAAATKSTMEVVRYLES